MYCHLWLYFDFTSTLTSPRSISTAVIASNWIRNGHLVIRRGVFSLIIHLAKFTDFPYRPCACRLEHYAQVKLDGVIYQENRFADQGQLIEFAI